MTTPEANELWYLTTLHAHINKDLKQFSEILAAHAAGAPPALNGPQMVVIRTPATCEDETKKFPLEAIVQGGQTFQIAALSFLFRNVMQTANIPQAAKIHLLSESLLNLLQDKSLRQIVVDTLAVANHAVTLNEADWAAIQAALKEDGDAEA